jgi:ribosomal-protein-alanine N-acetyltransferase
MDVHSRPLDEVASDWTVRAAGAEDIDHVARIERISFSDPWSAGEFRALLESPHAIFLVACDEHDSIGGYVVTMSVLDESEVLNIAVDLDHRGKSVGAMLLDKCIEEAEARGSRSTYLEVRQSNEPALRLYRSRGFEEVSRRRGYYSKPVEDALVLRRRSALMM